MKLRTLVYRWLCLHGHHRFGVPVRHVWGGYLICSRCNTREHIE